MRMLKNWYRFRRRIPQYAIRAFTATHRNEATLQRPSGNPSIGIVVPCYRHAAYLPATLASITAQTMLPDRVILIVDASPDNSRDIIDATIAHMDEENRKHWILLVNERNIGQAASLNKAIASAGTDIIAILNDDDYLMHDYIATMRQLFATHPSLALIGGTARHVTGNELDIMHKEIGTMQVALDIRTPDDLRHYKKYNDLNMTHSGTAFLFTAWKAVGGYYSDHAMRIVPFSDRDFQLRINALFPVGISATIPLSFWRTDSSVDAGLNS